MPRRTPMVLLSFGHFWNIFFSCFRCMPGVVLVNNIRALLSYKLVYTGIIVISMETNCCWTADARNVAVWKLVVYFFLEFQFDEHNGHPSEWHVPHESLYTLHSRYTQSSCPWKPSKSMPCVNKDTDNTIIVQRFGDFFLKGLVAQIIIFGQHSRSILGQQIQYLYHVKKRNL